MILAGAEIRIEAFRPRFLALQPHLPYRNWPFSWLHTVGPHSSGQYSGEPLCSDCQQAIWNTVQTCPEPVRLERVCRPSAWLTCSRNGARLWFCQQHQEFPSGLPSKYYPGPMLLNFSVLMGTGVSNMAQAADRFHFFSPFFVARRRQH